MNNFVIYGFAIKTCWEFRESLIITLKDLVIETSRTVIKGVTNLLGNS